MASALDKAIAKVEELLAPTAATTPSASKYAAFNPEPEPGVPAVASQAPAPVLKKKAKAPDAAAAPAAAVAGAAAPAAKEAFQTKVQIKVARIVSCEKQANSEKLLKMRADLGAGDSRQIMAGLQQFFTPEQLQGQLLCVVANLKPAKLAGEPSEAMVLAAETAGPSGETIVKTLIPPEGSQPGDAVHLDGSSPVEAPKVLKLDDWRKVSPGLRVVGGRATFDGTPLVTQRGLVTLPAEIPDGAEIH